MKQKTQNSKRATALFLLGIALLVGTFLINVVLGSVPITLPEIWNSFFHPEKVASYRLAIILKIRLPRALAALAGGACLAASGVLLQIFFNNPIVEPYILGVSSGSNLVLALMLLGGLKLGFTHVTSFALFLGAFLGAMLVMVVVIFASQKVKSITTLLIIGLMMGYVCSAGTSVLKVLADNEQQAMFTVWTMGSFAGFTWAQVRVLYLVALPFLFAAFLIAKPLNTMLLGEKYAQSMGLSIKPFRFCMVLIASVLTGIVTAFAGAISFVGLAVPHIVRTIFKTSDNRIVLPAACLYGAVMAGVCDLGARLLLAPTEIPLGAVTSLIGAPLTVYLLVRRNGGEL